MRKHKIAQLGSHLFARGALSTLTSLEFEDVAFDEASMISLMDGFRQSGHEGRTLKRISFERRTTSGERGLRPFPRAIGWSFPPKVSLALIAGLRDGLNLQELLAVHGRMLFRQVAELAEVMTGGAPCARTLRKVVMSGRYEPSDLEALRAVLPHATVYLENA